MSLTFLKNVLENILTKELRKEKNILKYVYVWNIFYKERNQKHFFLKLFFFIFSFM